MNKRNRYTAIGAALGMLLLILDGKTALAGAAAGLDLCTATLIPSLFPFFILSILLTGALSGESLALLRPIAAACKIPEGAEFLLPVGFLGGYPVGAQNVALMYQRKQISSTQASRLIPFCNNAGPAFIFGVLGNLFTNRTIPWLLWLIHITSALLTGLILPGEAPSSPAATAPKRVRITDALMQSIKVMAQVCGWVIFMRMTLAFMERWFLWMFPNAVQVLISGILELSNGCIRLSEIECEGLRFLMAAGFLSLGGICVTLQTASVAEGMSMRFYFPGKLLQCSFSILFACVFQLSFPEPHRCNCTGIFIAAAAITVVIVSILQDREKNSGISSVLSV